VAGLARPLKRPRGRDAPRLRSRVRMQTVARSGA